MPSKIKTAFPKDYDFFEVQIQPRFSEVESQNVKVEREFEFQNRMYSEHPSGIIRWTGVPIICVGGMETYENAYSHKMITLLQQSIGGSLPLHFNPEYCMVSLTSTHLEDGQKWIEQTGSLWIYIDGNSSDSSLIDFCRMVRKQYPRKIIVAGNVVSADMATQLIHFGYVDVAKVGSSPWMDKMGFGRKCFSSILDCAKVHLNVKNAYIAFEEKKRALSSSELTKAFAGGADFVICYDSSPWLMLEWIDSIRYLCAYLGTHRLEEVKDLAKFRV
jgi:GMP reductase